jgi:cystathionine beta-lyase
MGVLTRFYPPDCGGDIVQWFSPQTRMVFLESPGSATFEVQDVPAIAALAREHGILSAIDNTWATPLLFNPLAHGVDIAMQSGTKYLNGHADCLFGVCTTRDETLYRELLEYHVATGIHLAPDDAYLARRGLRTLAARLQVHESNGLALARWLAQQPQVLRLLHPAFPSCVGHDLYKRDFAGASGLFAVILDCPDEQRLGALLDGLELFGMGYSWGGFESLALPMAVRREHSTVPLESGQVLLRLHAGLEPAEALIADLSAGFDRAFS